MRFNKTVTYGEYNFLELRDLRYLVRNASILPNRRQMWCTQKLQLNVALKTTAQPGPLDRVFQISTFEKRCECSGSQIIVYFPRSIRRMGK